MASSPIFGIDLGTTCSAIAWVHNGMPRLIQVDDSDLLPSVVGFRGDDPPLVGQPALNRMALDPEHTIRSAKRWMGSNHRWEMGERRVSPVQVATLLLRRLAAAARAETGVHPHKVVITVPAWFTQDQRAETRQAGENAGLEVVRLINEPTAAALAHAHRQDLHRTALVYDLGGGTFDVSLVKQDGPIVEVQASHGDTHLGGDDFDQALLGSVLQQIAAEDPAFAAAIKASITARTKLLQAVEAAKCALSSSTSTPLRVPFIVEMEGKARHLDIEVLRSEFEAVIMPLLRKTLVSVDRVLADGNHRPQDVDELLFVGGSTHIPAVWRLLRERYDLEGSTAVPPERAVALGAAIQGAIVAGSRVDGILMDVAPYSLSISALVRSQPKEPDFLQCRVITPRNTALPALHTERFYTMHPYQRQLRIKVFQGSHPNPLANSIIGQIHVKRLPPAPEGQNQRPIDVEFRHNLDGMVDIRIIDVISGRSTKGQVTTHAEESARLREELLQEFRDDLCIPGDGSDPDPFNPRPEQPTIRLVKALDPVGPLDDEPSSAAEADEMFRSVLRKKKWFKSKHPDIAAQVLSEARRGIRLLADGQEDEAVALFESVADTLFDHQVFI